MSHATGLATGYYLPESYHAVPASCSQVAPIRAEGDCPYLTPAGELKMAITTLHLPDACGPILTSRSQVAPVRTERDITYVVPILVIDVFMGQANELVTALCLPDAYRSVSAGCCQVAPIWSEDKDIDAALVIQACDLARAYRFPHASSTIHTCRGKVTAI